MDPVLEDLEMIDDVDTFFNHVEKQKYCIRPRPDHFESWNSKEFFERFRLSKRTVMLILEQINDDIKNRTDWNSDRAVSTKDRLLLTLRYLATGNFLSSIGDFAGIHKSTAMRIINKVLLALCRMRRRLIKMPSNDEERSEEQKNFFQIARFPRVIGAIDCIHIKVNPRGEAQPEQYRNKKGFFSLNCQVVCDSKMKIQDIDIRPGSSEDYSIFENSFLKLRFMKGDMDSGILLGDSDYRVDKYLLTPLMNPQEAAEVLYNESQIKTRNIIERTLGVWKRRFPILTLGIRSNLQTAEMIIEATAVLHNIACQENENEFEGDEDLEGSSVFQVSHSESDCVDIRTPYINHFRELRNKEN